jgi:hypothetical protein
VEAIASGSIAATFKTLVKLVHPVTLVQTPRLATLPKENGNQSGDRDKINESPPNKPTTSRSRCAVIVAEYFGCVGTASWVADLTPLPPPFVIGFTPEADVCD